MLHETKRGKWGEKGKIRRKRNRGWEKIRGREDCKLDPEHKICDAVLSLAVWGGNSHVSYYIHYSGHRTEWEGVMCQAVRPLSHSPTASQTLVLF